MTEKVAGDCSSRLLETTSNRLWIAAKRNTHQLLQPKKNERKKREGKRNKVQQKKQQKCLFEDQRNNKD